MKRITLAAALLLACGPALAAEPAGSPDLSWISGAWVQDKDGTVTRETWSTPVGGAMGGVGQTNRPGKPASFEFMTITTEAKGVTYTAYVDGQPATPFVLKPGEAGVAVFENLAHDFPQRVIYRRCEADLCARIEGTIGGKPRAMEWRYRRER